MSHRNVFAWLNEQYMCYVLLVGVVVFVAFIEMAISGIEFVDAFAVEIGASGKFSG